jgi:hypothetical protein
MDFKKGAIAVGVHVMVWDPKLLPEGDPADWLQNGSPLGMNVPESARVGSFMEAVASALPIPEVFEGKDSRGDCVWCDIQNERCLVIFEILPDRSEEVLERIRILATFFDLKVHEPASNPVAGYGNGSRGVWTGRLLWITALVVATLFIVLKMIR